MRAPLRACALFILAFITNSISAQTYTFFGTGSYYDPAHWVFGSRPPGNIYAGIIININGNATVGPSSGAPDLSDIPTDNFGTINISAGSSLTCTQVYLFNYGTINIHGAFINRTNIYDYGSIHIYGSWTNGPLGGWLYIPMFNTSNFVLHPGGVFNTNNSFSNSSGVISGSGTINGAVNNSAQLNPGSSPGEIIINGDYNAAVNSKHNFEIAGTTTGQFDRLTVSGNVNLNGTLNVTEIGGFVPTTSHDLTIVTGTINGTFSTVNLPPGYNIIYNSNSILLRFNAPLPVNFIRFDARKENNGVNLIWKVSDEESVLKYEVEKSEDGRQFNKLGEIQASNQNSYSFVDRQFKSKSYYRVKSIDLDGKFRYSSIVTFNNGKSLVELMLFPNPAKDIITVQYDLAKKGSTISVLSASGEIVKVIILKSVTQQTSIDLSGLNSGFYIIQYRNSEGIVQLAKFSKQ